METPIRAGALDNYAGLLTKLGHDPNVTLCQVGLSLADLVNAEARLPYRSVLRAIEYPATTLGIPDFGLQLANEQTLEFLGPIFLAIQAAPNVHEALVIAAKYIHIHTPGVRIEITPDDREHERVHLIIPIAHRIQARQAFEHAVAHLAKLVSIVSQGNVYPSEICFRHGPLSEPARYRSGLGMLPHFEQPFDGIKLQLRASRRNLPKSNAMMLRTVEQYLHGTAPPHDLPIDQQLLELLPQLMRFRTVDISAAAAALRLNPRTMQRKLKALGTSFEALRDATRKALAEEYLVETSIPLARIAHSLGYSDLAVFHRSCQRWFGQTPARFREQFKRSRPLVISPSH